MVAKVLVDDDIRRGQELVRELDHEQVDVAAAVWFYDSDDERYRLLIATPGYDQDGPSRTLGIVQHALQRLDPALRVKLTDVDVVSPNDRAIQALRKLVRTGPGISGVRVSRNFVDDVYVDDAWVYRLN